VQLGLIYSGKGMYPDAIQAYQSVLQMNPTHPDVLYQLSLVYAAQKEYERAIEFCKRALVFKPNLPDGRYNLAKMYLKLGQQELEQAALESPDPAIQKMLQILKQLGD
jgi:tetratricopeptide (TPR) repeat protein